jgi:hypothetical protein
MNKNKHTKSLKRFLTMAGFVLITAASSQVYAQNGVGINPTGAAADPSAVLDASSTTQGFLPPRMTATQRDAIVNPATGLVVFCTNCGINGGELEVFAAGIWRNMAGGNAANVIAIGQSYGGGIIAYILQPSDPGYDINLQHGLIAAPTDMGSAYEWGCPFTDLTGADGLVIGTGNQNTIDINNECQLAIPAYYCSIFELNGYDDWYLPSKDELNKLYLNRIAIGSFAIGGYWSSSEADAENAWLHDFGSDSQLSNFKYSTARVRPVRSF